MIKYLVYFLSITLKEKKFLSEAMLFSIYFHLRLRLVGNSKFGVMNLETPKHVDLPSVLVADIATSIRRSNYLLPSRSCCLVNALTGKAMLKRRNIPSTLYLGVKKNMDSCLEAHAWLRCGHQIILGQHNLSKYTVISTFT